MDATSSRDDSASAWCAAVDLASHVAAGGHLPSVASRVLLEPGEVLHADVTAQGWRFAGADVTYAEPRAVAIGGPVMFGLVAATNAAARRRARREAEMLAAPHWRPLGRLRILATDRRLLVWHQAEWASVWSNPSREPQPAMEGGRLRLTLEEAPPQSQPGPRVDD